MSTPISETLVNARRQFSSNPGFATWKRADGRVVSAIRALKVDFMINYVVIANENSYGDKRVTRYVPLVFLSGDTTHHTHYFIEKGCCVQIMN